MQFEGAVIREQGITFAAFHSADGNLDISSSHCRYSQDFLLQVLQRRRSERNGRHGL